MYSSSTNRLLGFRCSELGQYFADSPLFLCQGRCPTDTTLQALQAPLLEASEGLEVWVSDLFPFFVPPFLFPFPPPPPPPPFFPLISPFSPSFGLRGRQCDCWSVGMMLYYLLAPSSENQFQLDSAVVFLALPAGGSASQPNLGQF